MIDRQRGGDNRREPAIFVARIRPDGTILLLGRSLLETLAFRRIVLGALATGLAPMLLLALATQVFLTGQVLKRLGSGIAAAALPAVYVAGFVSG